MSKIDLRAGVLIGAILATVGAGAQTPLPVQQPGGPAAAPAGNPAATPTTPGAPPVEQTTPLIPSSAIDDASLRRDIEARERELLLLRYDLEREKLLASIEQERERDEAPAATTGTFAPIQVPGFESLQQGLAGLGGQGPGGAMMNMPQPIIFQDPNSGATTVLQPTPTAPGGQGPGLSLPVGESEPRELQREEREFVPPPPVVARIRRERGALTAVLVQFNGSRLQARVGTRLQGGYSVTEITPDFVVVTDRNDATYPLGFGF